MNILIGADIVPTKNNIEYFKNGNINKIISNELIGVLDNSSFLIANLEVPLINKENQIKKNGPCLIADELCINGINKIGINLLTLANNHIMDQGEIGLNNTINLLKNNSISYVGVGKNLNMAQKPYIFEFANKKVGIYSCVEHEFSTATDASCGANPFDVYNSFDHIEVLSKKVDYVIVLYHGGKEEYRYPSPELQIRCRKMIQKGADLVICQHSHCIGCEEDYLSGKIIYGQGNFIFDYVENDYWNTSLLISIDDEFNISYIPIVNNNGYIELANEEKKIEILDEYKKRTLNIKKDKFVQNEFDNLAHELSNSYLKKIHGSLNIFIKVLNKLSRGYLLKKILKNSYKLNDCLILSNYINCESHHELLKRVSELKIKEYINDKK